MHKVGVLNWSLTEALSAILRLYGCSVAAAVARAHAVGTACSRAPALVVTGACVGSAVVLELIDGTLLRRRHFVVLAARVTDAHEVRAAGSGALAVHVVGAAVGSFWEKSLVDGALILALLLLVILAVGVADAVVEFTAHPVTLALSVIEAHAGAESVVILVNHALIRRSGLRLGFVLFIAVMVAHAPAELGAVSVSAALVTAVALGGSQRVLRLINVTVFGLFLVTLIVSHAEAVL